MRTVQRDMTMEEVRTELGISVGMLYKLINDDRDFVTFKIGAVRRMSRSDLDTWKSKQKQKEQVAA